MLPGEEAPVSAVHEEILDLAGAPVRAAWRATPAEASARGTVLFFHGLGASKDGQTRELHELAAAGFLPVVVDSVGHGQRRWADWDQRMGGEGWRDAMMGAVRQTRDEIPALIDALVERGWARPDRVGVAGISMGGMIAFAAPLVDARVSVCTPILGTPRWDGDPPDSPHRFPARFPPVALLAQNAGADESVPPDAARAFEATLRPRYRGRDDRLGYREYAGCGHFMPEDRWNQLWAEVLAWYQRWLPA